MPNKYWELALDQFLKLVQQAELSHQQRKAEIERSKVRVNLSGGGRKLRSCTY